MDEQLTTSAEKMLHVGKSVSTLVSVVRNILILLTALSAAASGGVTDRYGVLHC